MQQISEKNLKSKLVVSWAWLRSAVSSQYTREFWKEKNVYHMLRQQTLYDKFIKECNQMYLRKEYCKEWSEDLHQTNGDLRNRSTCRYILK